jgi:hypothetical protein
MDFFAGFSFQSSALSENTPWSDGAQEIFVWGSDGNVWGLSAEQQALVMDCFRNIGPRTVTVNLSAALDGDNSTAYVDAIRVTVFYTLPVPWDEAQVI